MYKKFTTVQLDTETFRQLVLSQGVILSTMALCVDVSYPTLNRWLRQDNPYVYYRNLVPVAEYLGVDITELVVEEEGVLGAFASAKSQVEQASHSL